MLHRNKGLITIQEWHLAGGGDGGNGKHMLCNTKQETQN